MKVGIPKETFPGEKRVALSPDGIKKITEAGAEVLVEKDAGQSAFLFDEMYEKNGGKVAPDAVAIYRECDIILKIGKPDESEVAMLREGQTLIALLQPLVNRDLVKQLAQKKVTAFSMDAVPRIARAQRMDALSSQSSIAGYKAVLIGASKVGKYLPMMVTAAATMPPAKVLVVGAGVAGLQAIATAHRLGAQVEAFDVRPAVKEQVQSLGGTFLELEGPAEEGEDARGYAKEMSADHQKRETEMLKKHAIAADIIITTALIPGKRAPVLITRDIVEAMKPGSVIVDLAAETGGNCELTRPEDDTVVNGVIITPCLNLASDMPLTASQLYSRNISGLLLLMLKDGKLNLDFEDTIIKDSIVTHAGELMGIYKDQIK